jgi:hypothetical protein
MGGFAMRFNWALVVLGLAIVALSAAPFVLYLLSADFRANSFFEVPWALGGLLGLMLIGAAFSALMSARQQSP